MATKIERLRNKTYKEALALLKEFGKAAIIRPTGFGKTGILTKMIKSKKYKKIIYLYPADIIRQTVLWFYYWENNENLDKIPGVEFMTYAALVNLKRKNVKKLYEDVDLIIADECHKLGANQTRIALTMLLEELPNTHLLGATATPERMDLVDEISLFFDNHVVSRYTLHDMLKDKVAKKPVYGFCTYGNADLEEMEAQARLNIDGNAEERENAESLLRSRLIEISHLQQMDRAIWNILDEHVEDASYLKFIVFFSNFKHLHDKEEIVKGWFQDAYPDHTVNTLTVTSESTEYSSNLDQLSTLTRQEKTIDLVYSCDMLNMGYHIPDLTGIVMYRGTESGNIFAQQFGRVLNSGTSIPGIVIDVVDNIHRSALYDVLGKEAKQTTIRRNRYQELVQKERIDPTSLTKKEARELNELRRAFESEERWWTCANDLMPTDLITTSYEATYREMMAKLVAEPISMRCRQAWKLFLDQGGDPDQSRSDYLSQTETRELQITPLPPFCHLKTVSVEAVLDEMGIVD